MDLVPSCSDISQGSNRGDILNRGAEKSRNYEKFSKQTLLRDHNVCLLWLYQHVTELKVELSRINYHIIGLSEVRKQDGDT